MYWCTVLLTSRVFDKVTKVLAREGESEVNRLKADLIRVLALYDGISWRSELIPDIIKLYKIIGRIEIFNQELVDEALSELDREKLITIEKKIRGAFLHPGTMTDKLIHFEDPKETLKALRGDKTFNSYMNERYKRVRPPR